MKRILIAVAALALLGAAPASAQYAGGYGGGYGGGGYRGGWDDDDDDDRRRRRRFERRDDRGYGGGGYGGGYGGPPRMRMGSMCVTSRGNCATRPAPHNSPCGCNIPGFGFKRGAVY